MAPLRGQTDLCVLPETFTSGFSNDAIHNAETMDGPTVCTGSASRRRTLGAADHRQRAIARGEGDAVASIQPAVVRAPDGKYAHYDKRHLFRMPANTSVMRAAANA